MTPDQKVARQPEQEAGCAPGKKGEPPIEVLSQIAEGEKGQENSEHSGTALNTHGPVYGLMGMGPRNPSHTQCVVEAVKNPEEQVQKKKMEIASGKRDEEKAHGNSDKAPGEKMPVFRLPGQMDHENLEKQRGEQSEVREQADLGIAPDHEALGIEDREDHRHRYRGGIVETMKER